MTPGQQQLEDIIQPLIDQICDHPLFTCITDIKMLAQFSEYHVYAVWDFVCLLKSLQCKLAPIHPLWLPPQNYLGCHLVNSLVTEEESDLLPDGRCVSHFALYVEAMQQCGANTITITQLIADIRRNFPLSKLLKQPYIPKAAKRFIRDTFSLTRKPVHVIAAAFAYAREAITSGMFTPILMQLKDQTQVSKFLLYFQRHIDLDGGKHSQQAQLLVASLCGSDADKWREATTAVEFALISRLEFLNAIAADLAKS